MKTTLNLILIGLHLPTMSEDLKNILTIYYLPILILVGICILGLIFGVFLFILEKVNPKAFKKVMDTMKKI